MNQQVKLYNSFRFSGAASNWWLRSPNTGNSNNFWNVNPSGGSNNNNATNSYGVAFGSSLTDKVTVG